MMNLDYRYYQDVMFTSLLETKTVLPLIVGLRRGDNWAVCSTISVPFSIWRWVSKPDGGIISIASQPVQPDCEPPVDGVTCYAIFDIEADRSTHPPGLRDYYIQWGERWDDPDDEIPWYRKRPILKAHRRRVKRARLFAEQLVWIKGQPISLSLVPLDPRDG